MKLLDDCTAATEALYNYFGYQPGWQVFPIDDCTRYFWLIDDEQVRFWDTKEAFETDDENHEYSGVILVKHDESKGIYPGAEYTAILMDTQTDGNKFFSIWDNAKRLESKRY